MKILAGKDIPILVSKFHPIYLSDLLFLDELLNSTITNRSFTLQFMEHFLAYPQFNKNLFALVDDPKLLTYLSKWASSQLGNKKITSLPEFQVAEVNKMDLIKRKKNGTISPRPEPIGIRLIRSILFILFLPLILGYFVFRWFSSFLENHHFPVPKLKRVIQRLLP